ncbi:MAG: hypothetical protein C1943_11220 [Halochromatium sp.]|nr:hypothetical protein [Halochromatium sp.]
MSLLPDSAFTRAALLIAVALIVTQLLVFVPLRQLIIAPAMEQMAISLADTSQLIAHLLQTEDAPQRSQSLSHLSQALGVRLDQTAAGPPGGEPGLYYQRVFTRVLKQRLGTTHPYRVETGAPTVIWVRASQAPPAWVGLAMRGIEAGAVPVILIWIGLGLSLALLIGFLLARSLTSGLRRLVGFARRIGRGEEPAEPPSTGPREVRELSQAMYQMARAIRRNAEERSLLLAGISHDLRTPLARMRLSLELAPEINDETRDSMVEDIDAIDTTVADFIASVRDEHDEPVNDCDLDALIRQTAKRLAGPRMDTTAAIDPEISLDLEPLGLQRLRPRAMARVLENLLLNARRHGAPPIQVEARRRLGQIRVSIFDHGPGVTADELDRLLDPFQRGRAVASTGSGLGLATARRIIQEHGGELSLHQRPAGGLEARIELPDRQP